MNKKSPGLARWKRLLSIKTFPCWKTPYVPNLVKGAMIVNENTSFLSFQLLNKDR